ncbi:unnamed protein product [Lactuca saligna]|uniref:Uncharacterized protein n=1 Tax=Lactuca saligna TaxID=75948 RepID=A0AA35V8K0_LACSI|nr:unnamed protein product [Lactuca saligna]
MSTSSSHANGFIAQGSLQWVLHKGVVRVVDRVIESAEFAKGVQDVRDACEALRFEKQRLLSACSTYSSKSEVPDSDQVASRAKEVNTALTSFVKTDCRGLLHLGELDYDGFRQFYGNLSPGCSSSNSKG